MMYTNYRKNIIITFCGFLQYILLCVIFQSIIVTEKHRNSPLKESLKDIQDSFKINDGAYYFQEKTDNLAKFGQVKPWKSQGVLIFKIFVHPVIPFLITIYVFIGCFF